MVSKSVTDKITMLEKLRKISEFRRLRSENEELRVALGREKGLEQLIGNSPSML